MGLTKGKKVFITGSSGFVGANLVRKCLELGSEVHILTRKTSDVWRIRDVLGEILNHEADLSNYDRIERIILDIHPDIIFHAAAYGASPSQKDVRCILESNLLGTVNLVNACKKVDFVMFVNTGSSSEYGIKSSIMNEDDLLEPVNDYGVSKSAATMYCQAVARAENLPIVTLRLFSPYGRYEGSNRLIPSTVLSCLSEENPKITSLSFVRDFIYIDDVLDAYIKTVAASEINGEIFNIGCGQQHSVGDVVNTIIHLTGAMVKPMVGEPQRWKNEPIKWQADISKAKRKLGWSPQYDLRNGLATTVGWFREHLGLYNQELRIL